MSLLEPNCTTHAPGVIADVPGSTVPNDVAAVPVAHEVVSRVVALGMVAVTTVDELAPVAIWGAAPRQAAPTTDTTISKARTRTRATNVR
ncbi:MAG: hypothetical protein JWL76_1393 [Thermoleophilia bacterium]|nr:hypothetical protein [Thermoleophilia bacterium]